VTILAEASVAEKANFFSGEHLAGQNSWEENIKQSGAVVKDTGWKAQHRLFTQHPIEEHGSGEYGCPIEYDSRSCFGEFYLPLAKGGEEGFYQTMSSLL
jgi:hypothetical protein